jgi:hypothetical protein
MLFLFQVAINANGGIITFFSRRDCPLLKFLSQSLFHNLIECNFLVKVEFDSDFDMILNKLSDIHIVQPIVSENYDHIIESYSEIAVIIVYGIGNTFVLIADLII